MGFGGRHELAGDALAAAGAQDEQLLDLGTVAAILLLAPRKLKSDWIVSIATEFTSRIDRSPEISFNSIPHVLTRP
jgi:hypothetical protein